MSSSAGPRCPGCGYPIFGIRDMRCPECGRTLDVRDFNLDEDGNRGDARRYERNSAIGAVVACAVLGMVLLPAVLLAVHSARYGWVSGRLILFIVFVGVWLVAVVGYAGQSIWAVFSGRRK